MKHDYHGKPASLSARLMRVARRYKREDRPEKAAELAALPKRELGENEKKRLAILIHIAKRREQLRHLGSIISITVSLLSTISPHHSMSAKPHSSFRGCRTFQNA